MKVELVVRPDFDEYALARFFVAEGYDKDAAISGELVVSNRTPERIVETAARLCYMSFGKGRKVASEFFGNLLGKRHYSVLEHVTYGFIVTGVSRSLTHELVRHRHLSFSQLSQRFVSDVSFVTPPALEGDEDGYAADNLDWITSRAQAIYQNMLESPALRKLPKKKRQEAARAVLPNCAETKIFVSGNVRAWREFIEKRDSPYADAEIQRLAKAIRAHLEAECPNLMGNMD